MQAILMLEDGTIFIGTSFGAEGEAIGEVVFNTCMTGYQEIITDPSYNGQMIAMTYPLIGNYGFNEMDNESSEPYLSGFIIKELCQNPSNWRCSTKPDDYFKKNNIVGIKDIDTRSLTQHIRDYGSMLGIISTVSKTHEELLDKIKKHSLIKRNLVKQVSLKAMHSISGTGKKVAILDLGVKKSILDSLVQKGCELNIFPYNSTSEEILECSPDGILISNGPGNPKDLQDIIQNIQKLVGQKPMLGISLGHQLLGLALGGNTYKLKFGHHGGNQPVKDLSNGRVYITSQNHNYALENNLGADIEITHLNINDNTVEGFRHKHLPILGIQYYPESLPYLQDAAYIFDDFIKMMEVGAHA